MPSCPTSLAVSSCDCISSDTESVTTLASASLDYEQEHSQLKLKTQNRVVLYEIALVCNKYSLFDCAGAAVATAVSKAYGVVSRSNTENVIDRIKLRRKRWKCENN